MWEFCLFFEKEQLDYILKLKRKIKNLIKNYKGAVVLFEKERKMYIAIDASNEQALVKAYKIIYNDIINIIYIYYKNKELNLINENMFNNKIFEVAVKEMLICFDEEYDKNIIKSFLYLDESLSLEGFYNFQLRDLKLKWQKLSNIILNNADLLSVYSINLDLIRYLLGGLENKFDKVCLHTDGNKYLIKSVNNDEIVLKRKNFSKKQNFIELVKNLIVLSPKKIILCGEMKGEDFKYLRDIFLEKL